MNRLFSFFAAVSAFCFASCAQSAENSASGTQAEHKVLVAYFSATGTTERVAGMVADAIGGDLYEIQPAVAYTSADLNWHDDHSRSSVEMNDAESRPALGGAPVDTESYDVIFIGYPIWWDQAPRIINTFIESHDLKGKTVVPFATSGSSGISNSVKMLKRTYPGLNWQSGKLLNSASEASVRSWTASFK